MSGHSKSEEPEPGERPKILYMMGAGRSGSTILGVALGNCEGVFFAGELDRWLARAGVPRRGAERERFWAQVRDEVEYAPQLSGRTTWLERSSSLLNPQRSLARRRLRPSYRRVSEDLYRALARVTGAKLIVDSSHYPMRARELRSLAGVELYLLFLVRDPQSVVASLGRADVRERRFGPLRANAYLWLTYLLSVPVFARHPQGRRMFVRYEDFLASPEAVLEQILGQCGVPPVTPDLNGLRTGVPFHGNRLIESELVTLDRAVSPRGRGSALTAILQRPWVFVFSRLRPAAEPSARGQAAPVTG